MRHPVTAFNGPLPNELVDLIIDHLHDDRAALSACSMVCKAWLPSSRYHLFSDIVLNPRNCDNILSLPPPSMFATAARRLMLTDNNTLPKGIEHFSSVKSFYLRAAKPCPDMTFRIPLQFPKITHLELNQVAFQSFGQMIQLICSFPHLETLTHFMSPWDGDDEDGHDEQMAVEKPPKHLRLSSRLRTLNILSPNLHIFFDWFNTLESPPPLTALRVYELAESHMVPVATAIETLGGSLEHLTMELLDHNHADTLVDSIDLSHNSILRSLTLINGWPKLLYQLLLSSHSNNNNNNTSHLQHLTLTIYEGKSDIPNLDLLDWDDLDHLLTAAPLAFRSLLDLTIRIYKHRLVSRVGQGVVEGEYMPLCGKAGRVRYVPERERILGVRRGMKGPVERRSWGEEIGAKGGEEEGGWCLV